MGSGVVDIAGKKLIIHESPEVNDPVTGRVLTGSWLWDSSLYLAEWIGSHRECSLDLEGKTVVELGAGTTGLPGLLAASLGANRVVLTDVSPLLPGLVRNAEFNGLSDRVEVKELRWGSDELPELGKVDLVLLSDVFYDAEEMPNLSKTLKEICSEETVIWSATEMRPWTTRCLDVFVREGFEVVEWMSRTGSESKEVDEPLFSLFLMKAPP